MLLVAAGAANAGALAPQGKASADSRISAGQGGRLLAARSAHFIENKGQWDPRARFLARTEGLDLWFTDGGIRYDNYVTTGAKGKYRNHAVGMTFAGGRSVRPVATKKARGRVDFVRKGFSAKGVGTYSELYAHDVYSGVDVRSYFDGSKPRYDLIVAPGASPKAIRLAFHGDSGLSIKNGALRVATDVGGFSNGKPVAYQTIKGKRVPVMANWKLVGKHEATFALGAYDRTKPLVIDPLVYGSYFGGNGGADEIRTVVSDDNGGVYLAGSTRSPFFPVRYGPYGLNIHGGSDALIAKLQGDAYNYEYASYIGGSSDDVGTFLKRDGAGNVWLAGTTASVDFPGYNRPYTQFLRVNAESAFATPNGGTFRLGVGQPYIGAPNAVYTAPIPWNATSQQVQTALRNIGLDATVTPVLRDGNGNLINRLSNGNPNDPVIGKFQIDTPSDQAVRLQVDNQYRSTSTAIVNEGISPSLHLLPTVVNGAVRVAPVNPGAPGNDPLGIANPNSRPSGYDFPFGNRQIIHHYGTSTRTNGLFPDGGSFTISFRNSPTGANPPAPTTAVTTPIPGITDSGTVERALDALGNKGSLDFTVGGGSLTNTGSEMQVDIADTANPPSTELQKALVFDNRLLVPQIAYEINGDQGVNGGSQDQTDIFVMRFALSGSQVIDPRAPQAILIFGSANADRFASFDIRPGQAAGDPVEFILAGSTKAQLVNYPGVAYPGSGYEWTGFLSRYTWTQATGFQQVARTDAPTTAADPAGDLPYVVSHAGLQVDVRGAVLDADGNAYVSGTVYGFGNTNTNENSNLFYTANNGTRGSTGTRTLLKYEQKEYGNQLRNSDAFIRKYERTGRTVFSGLIGGVNFDEAGGLGLGLDGSYINTGSNVAIDAARNVYVTGNSGSFDFLRTRGVYGEVFTDASNVFVTKISADAQTIIYSTNLNMPSNGVGGQRLLLGEQGPAFIGAVNSAGIGVDSRGYAYVTTNLRANDVTFPGPGTPPVPNQPTGSALSSIPLLDATDGTYDSPTGAEFPTTEGGLTVLNSTGTALVFGSYLGGRLDDFVYAPYVDVSGDVWAVGWTDSRREYSRGTTPYITVSALPANLISEFAFKETPDYQTGTSYSPGLVAYGGFNNNPLASGRDQYGYVTDRYVPMSYSRDGFITRFRINLPSVANLTFSPTSVPGGLGAFTTGTVTLSQAAQSGGTQLVVTLPSGTGAASLSTVNTDQDTITISIPEGATTATFRVYTKAVPANTSVSVRATVNGTFRERAFQVVPWLQNLTLGTDVLVGGDPNRLRGTITLAAPAPAGGVEVSLTSSSTNATIVDVPFTVPAGQTSASFDIDSEGVDANETVTITASLLGVTRTQTFTLLPATLQSITLTPDTVAGGSTATAVVTLNGKAGPTPYVVNLTSSNSSVSIAPTTVTIAPGESVSDPITVTTRPVAGNISVTITASHTNADNSVVTRSAVLRVQSLAIATLVLNPSTVESGGTSVATITLATSAPAGGARVYVSVANPALATLADSNGGALPTDGTGAYVLVAAGSKTATFQVKARYVGVQSTVAINAAQGPGTPKSATLTIKALNYTVSFNSGSVIGGSGPITGTVTLATPATETLTFTVSSSNTTVVPNPVPATVTIQAGSTTGTFTLRPNSVSATTNVTITVSFNGGSKTATLQVNPVGLLSIVPVQKTIRSGSGFLDLNVNFNGTTVDSAPLTISFNLESVFVGPRTITIPPGVTTYRIRYSTNRLNRDQVVQITAAYKGTTAKTSVTVTR